MITAGQLRAARALIGIDQRQLSKLAALSLPTIQRMEASSGIVRGNVHSLTKLIAALEAAGIEFIAENAPSHHGGCGVRLTRLSAPYAARSARSGKILPVWAA